MERERIREREKVEKVQDTGGETAEVPRVTRTSSFIKEIERYSDELGALLEELGLSDYISRLIDEITVEDEFIEDDTLAVSISIAEPGESIVVQQPAEETAYQDLQRLHPWLEDVRYEFMYSPPAGKKRNDGDYQEWLEEWSKVLFDFASIEQRHVVYIPEILNTKPFSALRTRQASLLEIANRLAKKELAVWVIKKEKLRVYWRTLEEWADQIYKWAYANIKTEPLFIYDLKEEREAFSTLPEDEFNSIFKILEKERRGRVVKSSDKKSAFVFEF